MGRLTVARVLLPFLVTLALYGSAAGPSLVRATELTIDAPQPLAAAAARIEAVDLARLQSDLRRAGLDLPGRITVALIPKNDPRACPVPPSIVASPQARPRSSSSLSACCVPVRGGVVFRHEVAHLALDARAGGEELPRWFHEGVAMSVEAGGVLRVAFGCCSRWPAILAPPIRQAIRLARATGGGAGVWPVRGARGRPSATPRNCSSPSPHAWPVALPSLARSCPRQARRRSRRLRAWSVYVRSTSWVPVLTSGWCGVSSSPSPALHGSRAAARGRAGASDGTRTTNRRTTNLAARPARIHDSSRGGPRSPRRPDSRARRSLPTRWRSARPAAVSAARRLIDVGGHRLHAVCRGDRGPAVLLESAIAGSSLSWTVVQPAIATFARVCAYDRTGLAWSDASSGPRTRPTVAELAAVLEQVHGQRAIVLLGHSFGSFVVRAFAARYPQAVSGVVLVDPPTEWLTTAWGARMLRGGRVPLGSARWRMPGWSARAWPY